MRASAYGPTIIAYRNGNPVRLDEVAHVYDGVENDKTASWQNGERCVYLSIQKQPGINVVQTVDAIKALLPAIREQLPASMTLDVRSDRAMTIRESVHDVKLTLMITIVPGGPRRSSCSSGTSPPRSFPAWRCPARSSARSR